MPQAGPHGFYGEFVDLKHFFSGKTVLITGHNGFKGSWLTKVLNNFGSNVIGYSLSPPTDPNLYSLLDLESQIVSINADVRDLSALKKTVVDYRPQVVIHMAAQPLVSVGYSNPVMTYETNVMGTVNILESIRALEEVSFLNVTTDKVYQNNEWNWGYRENDRLNGYDPYSNSKSCSELITSSYSKSFAGASTSISTARAGNVIGGGDFTKPRLIPDCVRAAQSGSTMILRNPFSTRPYQHVLESIFAYLTIAAFQAIDSKYSGSYNVGPSDEGNKTNEYMVKLFSKYWGSDFNYSIFHNDEEPHEANNLKLDCSLMRSVFGWKPVWSVEEAVQKTVELTKTFDLDLQNECIEHQISEYYSVFKI